MPVIVEQHPALADNYVFLIRDLESKKVAVIDPPNVEAVMHALNRHSWQLDEIWNTHHHWDHVSGNMELKERFNARVVGSALCPDRIPGIDVKVRQGDTLKLGASTFEVLEVPGHTRDHIAYWCESDRMVFCGDTLFSIGCGRLADGPLHHQLWQSLQKLGRLPDDTQVYCAHEYTLDNIAFALSQDPENKELLALQTSCQELRHKGLPTVPTQIGKEKLLNPFMRCTRPTEFASLRRSKDVFSS